MKFTIVNFILLKNILDNNLTGNVEIYPCGVGNQIQTLKIKPINLSDNINFSAVSTIHNLENKDDRFDINNSNKFYLDFVLINVVHLDFRINYPN